MEEVDVNVARAAVMALLSLPVVALMVLDERLADLNDSQQDGFVRVLQPRQCDTKTSVIDGRR